MPPSRRVRHGLAIAIDDPARRERFVVQLVHPNLAGGDGRGRHVQLERRIALRRGGEGERIRAHDGLRPEGRHHGHAAGGRGHHADHAAVSRDPRITARGAEVVRVEDRDDADTGRQALVDRQIHPVRSGRMTKRCVGVDERGRRVLAHLAEHRPHVETAGAELLVVGGEHPDAVRVDASQVGLDHHVRRGLGVGGGHAPGQEHGHELAANLRRWHSHGCCSGW